MDQAESDMYVIKQLQAGLSVEDIAGQLRNSGLTEDQIAEVFKRTGAQFRPTTQDGDGQPRTTLPEPIKRGRMKTGWLLFKQSLAVIKNNPGLSRYIIISTLMTMGIGILILCVMAYDYMNGHVLFNVVPGASPDEEEMVPTLAGFIFLVISGYIMTLIAYYYATALSSHTLGIFRGQTGDYRQHIGVARKKFGAIASYALIATLLGYLLNLLEERFKLVGIIVSRILGALWSLATAFTLPIIADSETSGPKAIGQSVSLFKKHWGETITGRVSLGGLAFLLYILISIPILLVVGLVILPVFQLVGFLIMIALFVIGMVVLGVFVSLADSILNTSLYYYARYGSIPSSFSPELLASVFVDKKKKK